MNSATITVASIERKEGVAATTGKPWTMYRVIAQEGGKYATFDSGLGQQAGAAVGRRANITYETTEKGDNLKSLVIDESAPPVVQPVQSTAKPNGEVNWDLVGLHKTRCALWAALFSGNTLAGMPESQAITTGIGLVRGAEGDIFNRPAAGAEEDIPFLWADGFAREFGIHFDPWRP
jgi:hypothetical protein